MQDSIKDFIRYTKNIDESNFSEELLINKAKKLIEKSETNTPVNLLDDKFYLRLLSEISDTVILTELDGSFSFICPNIEYIFGYKPDEIAQMQSINKLITGISDEVLQFYISNKNTENEEYIITSKQGKEKHLLVNIKLVNFEKEFILFTCRNITQRKQIEFQLKEKNEEIDSLVEEYTTQNDKLSKVVEKLSERNRQFIKANKELHESKERFKSLFENALTGIFYLNTTGDILEINKKVLEILGSPSAEATKAINIKTFKPLIDLGYTKKYDECLKRRESVYGEIEYTSKWGKHTFVRYYFNPIIDKEDYIIGVLANIEDISVAKEAEKKLLVQNEQIKLFNTEIQKVNDELTERNVQLRSINKQLSDSQLKYKSLLNNMNSGVAIYNAINEGEDFVFSGFNSGAEKIEGLKRETLIGKRITEAFPGVKNFGLFEVLQRVNKTGNPEHFEDSYYEDDRISGWRRNYIYKLRTGEIVAVYEDVTDQKTAQQKLSEKNKQYEAINEELSESNNRLNELNDQLKKSVNDLKDALLFNRAILNGMQDGLTLIENQKVKFYNDKAIEIFGYPEDEFVTKSGIEFAAPEERQRLQKIRNHIKVEKKSLDSLEFWILRKDGEKRYIKNRYVMIENGKTRMTITTDITEQKKAQNELMRIFELSADMICVASLDGYFLKTNPAFTKILGWEREELQLKSFYEFIHPEDVEITEEIVSNELKKGIQVLNFENRYRCKNGEYKWISWVSQPIVAENVTFAIARDITEQKRIEKELIMAKEKAEESDRLKSAFLANMSHEIRTPMNSILGFSKLLKNDRLTNEKKEKYVNIINSSGNQLLTIISDIVDISKIEADQIDLYHSDVNLNEMLNELYTQFIIEKLSRDRKNVRLFLKKGLPDELSYIDTDEVRVRQIIINLVNNAIKFTKDGYVKYGYEKNDDNTILFFVEDTGIGIPKEQRDVVFERFRQVDGSHTRKFGGTGLGLTICKGLVELLGGKIWVESTEELGTTFFFTIPYLEAREQGHIEKAENVEENIKYDWIEKKILVVEDVEFIYQYIEELLMPTGVQLLYAPTGSEAIRICKEDTSIDLVLMDIQLPDISGLEATAQIKKFRKELPVLAQTAYAQSGDREMAMTAGCSDYMSKPLNKDVFFSKIARFL